MTRINPKKAVAFVKHIQAHLDNNDLVYVENRKIPPGLVGCKICNRSIENIWEMERSRL